MLGHAHRLLDARQRIVNPIKRKKAKPANLRKTIP